MTDAAHPGPARIDVTLARQLVAAQFPRWRDLPLRPVRNGGNDHRVFRLGDDLSVRLPSAAEYVPQVRKEQAWLPRLAPAVRLPIPTVEGVGEPSPLFPAPWSVYGWLPGAPASVAPVDDAGGFAADLAAFLAELGEADPTDAPGPGPHSAFRGGPLEHWDDEMSDLLLRVHGRERDLAAGIWRDALAAPFTGSPRWFHGDVSLNNLLVRDGRLAAVIDFGCSGAGDPACDTVFRWTSPDAVARAQFHRDHAVDDATWARGRGWALWKGLIMITNKPPGQAEFARQVLERLFSE
ncbi:aminoglycoside phosphotransferase family protein [Microbacterium sp. M3]|uniref:Aminoglycoside phosphotransferase family protein n=1 Tax=Microbacterium arthrosphaerae TaxID=792652 RepID=A0ABU4H2X1_9MICO|nr:MULTISPECIES: aminoglycoside phosphotransferase family protein [Microbacterium]MDW4573691.1 aminoglycoside phosphotransferase family protein [Microbacterium arthrosphaerae]MDW7607546.1 aminoglycoside phosphotransferase family protein [Microbacterium sp. M3]